MKTNKKSLIETLPKRTIKKNRLALGAFDLYQEAASIIDRTNIASGRKAMFQTSNASTLISEINTHAISSTQKI